VPARGTFVVLVAPVAGPLFISVAHTPGPAQAGSLLERMATREGLAAGLAAADVTTEAAADNAAADTVARLRVLYLS